MGRRKIEIKAIKDDRNRSVTFLKRKGGLFKKAHELSVLCSVDVAVIIFGHNKKLYEFSSGDINEIIGRYQYYGNAHEHKGPSDFNGGKDADEEEEDEMASPPPGSHSSQDHPMAQAPHPHQLQDQPGFQHMRHHTPSASPPVPNGVPFHHRHSTPQPQHISRPSSGAGMRRASSNLVPQHVQQHTSQAPPGQNGYAYQPVPPIYNAQAGAGMPLQPDHAQAAPYHQFPPQGPPHPQAHAQAQHVYMQEQRRASMPPTPAFPQERPQQPQPQPQPHSQPQPQEPSPPRTLRPPEPHNMSESMSESGRGPSKSRSIFTPVDESRSLLAQHWGMGTTSGEQQVTSEPAVKAELPNKSRSVDFGAVSQGGNVTANGPTAGGQRRQPLPPRNASMSSLTDDTNASGLSNAQQAAAAQGGKRPRLKVQIPDEPSDGGSATGDSSPRDSTGTTTGGRSARPGTEGSHSSGVVLPPPSPSASALLSAGAQGPPNPFARPNPPSSAAPNNSIDTPISALPSRFMADGLLPSPSSFYPEWGFGRSAGDSNMLPSPLNFQTPVAATGPSFLREDPESMKRKSPDGEGSDGGAAKRMKT
ncbi:MAG: hypothetical protein M1832_001735 [Thelocarpon impressellum]|nr:MAG: hypothetical protein M1832_001735 [Thelocarpon impressellum]